MSFPQAGADLGGVAVDGLPSAEDEVRLYLLGHAAECVAGGESVGAGEGAVGQKHGFVGSAVERVAEHFGGGGRPHGGDRDFGVAAVLELEGQLKRIQVFRIEDRRQCGAVDRSVGLHCVPGDILGVRNLLYEYEYGVFHISSFVCIQKRQSW